MGEKNELFHCGGKMLTYDAAIVLEDIVAGLRQGKLAGNGKDGPVCIDLPALTKMEVDFREKAKSDKTKRKLLIELSWKEGDKIGLED